MLSIVFLTPASFLFDMRLLTFVTVSLDSCIILCTLADE